MNVYAIFYTQDGYQDKLVKVADQTKFKGLLEIYEKNVRGVLFR